MPEAYSGPVMYIVHGPLLSVEVIPHDEVILHAANRKKIQEALRKAAIEGIPVIYEAAKQENLEELKKFVESLKSKPRICWVIGNSDIKRTLEAERVSPTKFVMLGYYRQLCVQKSTSAISRAFPYTPIHVIEGASTVLSPGSRPYRKDFKRLRRVIFSKKLTPRHFV